MDNVARLPNIVSWIVTLRCNMKCLHCYPDAGKPEVELDNVTMMGIIDGFAQDGVTRIFFSGGEVLLRKGIFDVLAHASQQKIEVWVCSNGSTLNPYNVRKLVQCDVKTVSISLDSADPRIHDSFRHYPGAYTLVERAVDLCHQQNIRVILDATATRYNFSGIEQIVDFASKHRIGDVLLKRFLPVGRGERNATRLILASREYEKVLLDWYWRGVQYDVAALSHDPQSEIVIEKELGKSSRQIIQSLESKQHSGCFAGCNWCGVMPNGDVTPCPRLPIPVGNILSHSLREIYRESKVLAMLNNRHNLRGHCGNCVFRRICGGCRAHAYAVFNDYLGEDPLCSLWEREA